MASPGAVAALRREVRRKALHLATAILPISYAWGVPRATLLSALGTATFLAFAIEGLRRRNAPTRARFERWAGSLLRERERLGITGATWLSVSCLAVCVLLPRPAAIAALWCVTAGDSAAALSGGAWKAWRAAGATGGGERTLVGSVALAVVGAAGVHLLAGSSLLVATLVGIAAAAAERIPGGMDDNLTVAFGAGIAFLAAT